MSAAPTMWGKMLVFSPLGARHDTAFMIPNLPQKPGESLGDWRRRVMAGAVRIDNIGQPANPQNG